MGKLDEFTVNYNYRESVMGVATIYCCEIFLRYMKDNGRILELGPAEGVMTELLYPKFHEYYIVEGAKNFADLLQIKYPKANITCSYFENYEPDKKFDSIILGHVLEHVDNPVNILEKCKNWLKDDGIVLCAVPNSHSLHRQAAVKMGMLKSEDELNETDRGVGHQRVYNLERLKSDFENADLKIHTSGGYWIKPLSNGQIDETWNEQMISAYMALGEEYPEIAAEIYVVAGN